MPKFIESPDHLLKELWNDSNVHIVEKEYYFYDDKFCLIDISIDAQGQDQDKIYVESSFYRQNIRRGNSLIEIFDSRVKNSKTKIEWARKGTQKIIDIKLEYLQSVTNNLKLNVQQQKCFQTIFNNVNKAFQNKKKVQLIKTQKANGENAQVSYNYHFDSWIICSKNVSLLARDLTDLKHYDSKRYVYAKQIAKQWFLQIKNLDQEKLKELKKLLDGYTIVGQYCGNQKFQHLIKYNQTRIIWFAMIQNASNLYCLDPFQVKSLIQQFGFAFVKIKRYGSFSDKKQFYSTLQELYLKTAGAGLQDFQFGMEGSIVYFVSPQMKNGKLQSQTLGSGKLKTIQYRFFRKIRQKLSRYINKKQSQKELLKRYKVQCEQLQRFNKSFAPFPFQYYQKILKSGCQLIRQTNISQEFLRSRFVSILKLIFYVLAKNLSLKKFGNDMIDNSYFLSQISKIPFAKYGGLGCNTKIIYIVIGLPNLSKIYLAQKIGIHFQELKLPYFVVTVSSMKKQQQQPIKNSGEIVEQVFNKINNENEKSPFLIHYYLDMDTDCQMIFQLIQKIDKYRKLNTFHKIVLIKDWSSENQYFCQGYNTYPFSTQTIIMSYYLSHQDKLKAPTIKQKIQNLKIVTKALQKKLNFDDSIAKKNIQTYKYPFSKNIKLENKQQLNQIIANILCGEKEYENYCRLILNLQKMAKFKHLEQQTMHKQIQSLIKSSFPSIPTISFKK